MWICTAPCRDHTYKALMYGTRSQAISQFYLHTPASSADGMNHICLCLPSRSWYSFTGQEGWKAKLALGGWLVTYRNRRGRPAPGIEPGHGRPSQYYRARRRLTSLIEANAVAITPDHQL